MLRQVSLLSFGITIDYFDMIELADD